MALQTPRVLQVKAGVTEIVFLRGRRVVGNDLERHSEGLWARAVEDGVDPLAYFVNIRVVAISPLEPELEIMVSRPIGLVPGAACGPLEHPRRILKRKRGGAR